jgi:hypothetical protein
MLSVLRPSTVNVAVTALLFLSFVFPMYAFDSGPCASKTVDGGVELGVASADPQALVSADCSIYSSIVTALAYVNGDLVFGFVEDQNFRFVAMVVYWYVLGSVIGYLISAVRKGDGKK